MGKLDSKVVVVTGGSRGIGAAIARRLGAEGAKVVVNYARDEGRATEVVAAIHAAGGKAVAVQADVADEEQVKRLFDRTDREYGPLDVLVNNAGIMEFGPIDALDRAMFLRLVDTHLWSVLVASREAQKRFGDRGGKIINISSSGARQALGYFAAYAATKAGVEAVTRCLAEELGPRGIRVNAIAPGGTETDMNAMIPPEAKAAAAQITPLRRFGRPEDFGGVAAFLASADADWITGQVIPVNGGYVV
jgi:3-oxoacyl-[acyl-carrier protein] reductase